MPIGNPHATFEQDEEFRQSVIRKALLLGFCAGEWDEACNNRWAFMFEGKLRTGYCSCYSAAYDYLRLLKIPHEVIGDFRG
jgi:hypothetical protein